MEFTINQRIHLLQAEEELQVEKSHILASKHASIRSIELKCLMLDQKIAAQNLKITVLGSSFQYLDSKHHFSVQELRLKSKVEELKELDEERDKYYELKCLHMNEFLQNMESLDQRTGYKSRTWDTKLRKYNIFECELQSGVYFGFIYPYQSGVVSKLRSNVR